MTKPERFQFLHEVVHRLFHNEYLSSLLRFENRDETFFVDSMIGIVNFLHHYVGIFSSHSFSPFVSLSLPLSQFCFSFSFFMIMTASFLLIQIMLAPKNRTNKVGKPTIRFVFIFPTQIVSNSRVFLDEQLFRQRFYLEERFALIKKTSLDTLQSTCAWRYLSPRKKIVFLLTVTNKKQGKKSTIDF